MRSFIETYYGTDITEDLAPDECEAGPDLAGDVLLSARPGAPPRTGPRKGRNRRSYDRRTHDWRVQLRNKLVDEQKTDPRVNAVASAISNTVNPAKKKGIVGHDASSQAQEDIAAEPMNKTGDAVAGYHPVLGKKPRKRKRTLEELLDVERYQDVSENIGPPVFVIQMQMPNATSQWRDVERIPADFQMLTVRMNALKAGLPPGSRVRAIDGRTGALVDILP